MSKIEEEELPSEKACFGRRTATEWEDAKRRSALIVLCCIIPLTADCEEDECIVVLFSCQLASAHSDGIAKRIRLATVC